MSAILVYKYVMNWYLDSNWISISRNMSVCVCSSSVDFNFGRTKLKWPEHKSEMLPMKSFGENCPAWRIAWKKTQKTPTKQPDYACETICHNRHCMSSRLTCIAGLPRYPFLKTPNVNRARVLSHAKIDLNPIKC